MNYETMTNEELRAAAEGHNYYAAYYALAELRRRGVDVTSVATVVGQRTTVEGWDACCRASGNHINHPRRDAAGRLR